MVQADNADPSDTPTPAWLATCTVLCLAIIAYSIVVDRDTIEGIAYQLGYNLPIAAFFGALLYLAFRRRVSIKVGGLGFGLIFAALMVGSVLAAVRQQAEMRQLADDLKKSYGAAKSNPATGSMPTAIPTGSGRSGEAAKMAVVVNKMLSRGLAQRQAYEKELAAIGWDTIIEPKRLIADKSQAESAAMIRQARAIMQKYAMKSDELYSLMRADIADSELGPNSKASMLAGFDKSGQSARNKAAKVWVLEGQALDQVENVIKLLAEAPGMWSVDNGQVMFQRQQDADQFNGYMARVQELVAQQDAIQNKALTKAQDRMDTIGR